jgi:hypothetical protein
VIRQSLETLVAAFNRGSLDVPAGLLSPHTAFTLNGRSYESILGGAADDPLIRLLARGPGAYRTAAKAVQYALQQPMVVFEPVSGGPPEVVAAAFRLTGTLRDSGEPFESHGSLRLTCAGTVVTAVDVECSDADLQRIAQARRG